MQTKRIFIAFPVSKEIRWEVERVQAELIGLNKRAHVKWVKPDRMHVTVQFLGKLIDERVEQVKEVLNRVVKNHQRFEYWLDSLDAFPNKSNPNVIVVKIGEEHRESYLLQEEIISELKKIGIIGDENHAMQRGRKALRWKPHLTIGRNKRHDKIVGFDTVEVDKVVWEVNEVQFIESELTADGPKYTILEIYPLK